MRKRKKKGYYIEYPKRGFLIYPVKYNELFIVLPICFVMFFIKGGGWAYSIALLIGWFVIATHWTKTLWQQECHKKGNYKVYHDGVWINQPKEPRDYHEDSKFHKHDDLHYLYSNGRWESRDEVVKRFEEDEKRVPSIRSTNKVVLEIFDKVHEDYISKGR